MWLKLVVRLLILVSWTVLILAGVYLGNWSEQQGAPQVLNIFTWSDLIPRAAVQEFTRQTGYRVNLSYYSNVEELLTKLQLTPQHGYDLIITSDYAVPTLIETQQVQPLDRTQLNFWSELDPHLLNFYYDPQNRYTVPLYWDLYGIGYRTELNLAPAQLSWQLLFAPAAEISQSFATVVNLGAKKNRDRPRLAMLDNGLENLLIAGQFLYPRLPAADHRPATATAQVSALATAAPPFTPAQLTHLQTLLRQQKPAVVAYTDEQAGRLLANGSVQLAATPAALLRRVQRAGAPVKFGLPPEGGFITVEACLIAQDTTKLALVYRFLNLLYQRELLTETVNNLGYLPVFTDLLRNLNLNDLGGYQQLFNPMIWQQLEFFQRRMTRAQASEIWVAVKAS